MTTPPLSVAVVIPAKDESARVAATIRGGRRITGVRVGVVVDDGAGPRALWPGFLLLSEPLRWRTL